MDSAIKPAELIVQQGHNVLVSMKDLKRRAKKKGKERSDLYQKFCANQHSFTVYTFMDSAIKESAEVQSFHQQLELFSENFEAIRTNFEAEVDLKHIEASYEEVFTSFNSMVNALGFSNEAINVKRF